MHCLLVVDLRPFFEWPSPRRIQTRRKLLQSEKMIVFALELMWFKWWTMLLQGLLWSLLLVVIRLFTLPFHSTECGKWKLNFVVFEVFLGNFANTNRLIWPNNFLWIVNANLKPLNNSKRTMFCIVTAPPATSPSSPPPVVSEIITTAKSHKKRLFTPLDFLRISSIPIWGGSVY